MLERTWCHDDARKFFIADISLILIYSQVYLDDDSKDEDRQGEVWFYGKKEEKLIAKYQEDLRKLDDEIELMNSKLKVEYTHMQPSRVPKSIAIWNVFFVQFNYKNIQLYCFCRLLIVDKDFDRNVLLLFSFFFANQLTSFPYFKNHGKVVIWLPEDFFNVIFA